MREPVVAPVVPEPEGPSDVALMTSIQVGDPDALSHLYDRYSGILKALILRIIHNETEADDLLQEVFLEIWNQAKNFSAKKGKPLGWMVTLTRRRAIDALRKRQAYARAAAPPEARSISAPIETRRKFVIPNRLLRQGEMRIGSTWIGGEKDARCTDAVRLPTEGRLVARLA